MCEGIVWEDPPESKRGPQSKWSAFVEELQKHPGKWAIAAVKPYNPGSYRTLLIGHGCETTTRDNHDGTWTIYARWPEDT